MSKNSNKNKRNNDVHPALSYPNEILFQACGVLTTAECCNVMTELFVIWVAAQQGFNFFHWGFL